jgi:Family of unknown function (DUF6011)
MIDLAIWKPIPTSPMPMPAALREAVLARSTKRMPIWKFRLAQDIVMQMQPKPTALPRFECKAIICDNATADLLKLKDHDRPRDSWLIKFALYETMLPEYDIIGYNDDGIPKIRHHRGWFLKPTCVAFHTGHPHNGIFAIRDRLFAIFPAAFERLRPDMMLKPSCLACGKELTDPVSMARFIGPECFGSSSALMPYIVVLTS